MRRAAYLGRDEHIVEHHRGKGVERVDEAYAIRRYQQAAALLPLRWQRLCRQVPEEQLIDDPAHRYLVAGAGG